MNVHTKRVKRFLEQLPNKILVSKYRDLLGNYLEIKISENLTRFSYLEDRIMRKTTTEFNPKESIYKCSCNDTPYCKHIAIIVWLKILQWNLSENIYNLDMGLPIKKEFKPILEVLECTIETSCFSVHSYQSSSLSLFIFSTHALVETTSTNL